MSYVAEDRGVEWADCEEWHFLLCDHIVAGAMREYHQPLEYNSKVGHTDDRGFCAHLKGPKLPLARGDSGHLDPLRARPK
jgi:hypothetical protein